MATSKRKSSKSPKTPKATKAKKSVSTRPVRVKAKLTKTSEHITLADLRTKAKKTQVEVAKLTEQTQAALSGFENRDDRRVSSLRRYVKALGGKVEVIAIIKGTRYLLYV